MTDLHLHSFSLAYNCRYSYYVADRTSVQDARKREREWKLAEMRKYELQKYRTRINAWQISISSAWEIKFVMRIYLLKKRICNAWLQLYEYDAFTIHRKQADQMRACFTQKAALPAERHQGVALGVDHVSSSEGAAAGGSCAEKNEASSSPKRCLVREGSGTIWNAKASY